MNEYRYIYQRNPLNKQGYTLISRAKTNQEVSEKLDELLFMKRVHPRHILVSDSMNFTQKLLGEGTDFDVGT